MIDWKPFIYFESLASTQDYLLALDAPLLNTVVYTHHQSKGRGTHHKMWQSDPGDFVLSFQLNHQFKAEFLVMSVSLALIDTFDKGLKIKPPNDLLLSGKKCGGILIEQKSVHQSFLATIGIGINLKEKKDDDYAWINSKVPLKTLIKIFQDQLNLKLQCSEDELFKQYHDLIDFEHLNVFYQNKSLEFMRLNQDFTCETSLGNIPMAHLNFEII
jgi:biotin-[acetyl-CoA-carboxylase] ligase BirA-like protein